MKTLGPGSLPAQRLSKVRRWQSGVAGQQGADAHCYTCTGSLNPRSKVVESKKCQENSRDRTYSPHQSSFRQGRSTARAAEDVQNHASSKIVMFSIRKPIPAVLQTVNTAGTRNVGVPRCAPSHGSKNPRESKWYYPLVLTAT